MAQIPSCQGGKCHQCNQMIEGSVKWAGRNVVKAASCYKYGGGDCIKGYFSYNNIKGYGGNDTLRVMARPTAFTA
jgi:hypothetical protein